MKRIGNIYNNILDIKVINDMYKKIKRNTKNKRKVEVFESNYVSNISYVKDILENKTYKVGKYNIFLIREPKLRIVMSQNIIDKLINHLVSKYFLVDIFESSLINENVATRLNKGTKEGINLTKKYLNKVKDKRFYILKFDISKYFYNIDHKMIKNILVKKIKDKNVLDILFKIIDSTDESYVNDKINNIKRNIKDSKDILLYKKGKGLPIGNMSSQFLAILYLNELDHFIKKKLNIKYYVRYMDDGILIHEDKEYLKYCLNQIDKIIKKYKLELNHKTKIYKSSEGFDFLGFKYVIKNNKVIMKVKNETKKRFKKKLKKSRDNKQLVLASYIGHLGYGNCKKLILHYLKSFSKV